MFFYLLKRSAFLHCHICASPLCDVGDDVNHLRPVVLDAGYSVIFIGLTWTQTLLMGKRSLKYDMKPRRKFWRRTSIRKLTSVVNLLEKWQKPVRGDILGLGLGDFCLCQIVFLKVALLLFCFQVFYFPWFKPSCPSTQNNKHCKEGVCRARLLKHLCN